MIHMPKKAAAPAPKAPQKKATRKRRVAPSRARRTVPITDKDTEYLEALKATVTLLKSGWFSARELAAQLGISHQSPWNRLRKLRGLGFKVKAKDMQTSLREVKRFHIEPLADAAADAADTEAKIRAGLPS